MINNNSKKPDDRLRDNCSSLIAFLESTDDMIWSVDREYRLIEANSVFLEYTESFFNKKIEAGSTILDKNMPEYLYERWKEIYDTVFEGKIVKRKIESKEMSGAGRALDGNFYPIKNEKGEIVGCSAYCRDVSENLKNQEQVDQYNEQLEKQIEQSERQRKANLVVLNDLNSLTKNLKKEIEERKKVEEALRESELFVNAVANSTPALIYIYDHEKQKNIWANDVHEDFFAEIKQVTDLELDAIIEIVHPEDLEILLKETESMINEKRIEKLDLEIRIKKSEEWVWMNIKISPFKFDEEGNITQSIGAMFDINDKKKAEKELVELNNQLLLANSIAKLGYWNFDVNAQKPKWSKELFEMYGIPEESGEPIYEEHKKYIHPDDWDLFDSAVQKAITEGVPYDIQIRLVHPDGKVVWVRSIAISYMNNSGEVIQLHGTALDITLFKEQELELAAQKELFESIVDNIPVMITRYDPNAEMLLLNKEAEALIGWSSEEAAKVNFIEEVYPDPEYRKAVLEYMAEARNDWREFDVTAKNGEIITSEWSNIKLKDGSQIGIGIDVRERNRAQRDLIENEKKYRSLFENQIESYAYHEMIFDEKDNPVDYRFIDVNKKFLEQTGLKSKEEIIGKTVLEIWPETDQYWINIYGKVAKTGEAKTFEDYSTPLNKHFFVNVYSPKPGFFATSFMDITEKVKAEKAQKEADEKLRNIMLNSTNMFYQHGIDHKLTFVSPQVKDIIGYTPEEAKIKWTDLVSDNPINNEGHKKTVEAIETGKAQAPYQLEMTHKNGDNIYVEVREVPVKEDGKVTSIVGSLVDITEKKKAERDLKESESRYKNLFDYSPVSLWEEDYSKVHKEILKLKESGITDLSKYINDNPEFIENCIYLADILDISRSAVKLYGANSKKDLMKNLLENAYHIRPIRMFKTALLNIFDSHLNFRGEDTINTLDGKSLVVSVLWEAAPGHEQDYSKVYVSEINITERVKYEEELRASEERFKLFMKYLPGGVFIKDSEFKYTFMNEFNENLLGMTNWRGKTVYDCFDKDLAETFAKDDLKVFEKGFVRKEATVKSVDGKTMYFLNTQFLIPGADKPTLGGISIDITEKKKAEEEIQINLTKYKTLFDSLPAGITVTDKKGKIIESNREAEMLLGLGEEDHKKRTITGKEWKIIRTDGTEMSPEEFASVRALKENKKISNIEMGIYKKAGDITWINVTATPIPLEDYGVVITYFDISDRVAAAKALKESEEKFRSIFYNAQIGIFRTDAKDGKLLMANQKTAEIFGYKTTAAARRYYKLSEHYIDPDAREKLVEQVRKEGRIDNYEAALTNRFNEPRWLKYSVHYKKEGDYFEGVVEDITEKKLLQNKYETIVHNFPNGAIFLFDKEMRYSFTGGNALAREGIKSESLIGYKPNEVWPEDLAKIVMSNNRQILNGNLVNYETKFNDKIFTNWGVPIYEGDNIVNGLVYSVDITELKERNEFIQTVLDNLPIGVALNNIDEGNSFYQNKKFEEIYGWPSKELENIPDFFRKVYPDKEYREKLIERVRTDIETGDQSKMFWENCIITHKDGSKHIVDAQNIPLFKQNTMVSTVRDVTAQKEAENKLRESEALLQAALDNSQAGIAIAEVPDGKLRYVNRAGLMIRGKDEEELVKNIDIDKYVASWKILYLDGREYEPENVPLARAVLNGETVREEFMIRRDNMEDRYVLAHAAPINNELGERIAAIVIFLDITEKKIIEYQLKESEARTRAIFENSLTGIVLAEKDGTILEANPALIKMLGSPSLEASKAINIINFEPLKKIGFSDKFTEAVEKNRITGGEDLYESKWGKKLVVNYSFIPVRRQSKVQRIIGTVEDVTKLREAETALLESEEKYRILVENQNDLVVKTDADGRFEFVSQSYCELFGKSEKELLGSSFIPLIHEEDKKHTEEELKKLETPPYECEIEQRAKTKFGWRWFSWSDKAVVNENGEIESIIGVGRDITERKLAEFQVIEEKNKAEKYLETAGVLMLALDNNCIVTLINQRGADIIGYSKDYIIGKHWINNFIPKENRKEVNAVFKKAMRGEVDISMYFENPVLCRYNKVRILGWRNNLLRDDDENIIGILSSAEDVTESIRLKENLQKSNEELFRLSDHLKDIREREKLALARELHDDLGQALTAVKMDLMLAYHELGDDNESLKSKIESAVNLTTHSIKTTQDITSDLRPSMIDDLGLIPAIEWYAKKFGDRSKIKVEVDLTVKDIDIDENNKINLYRIVQECLTNVARHSMADKVTISMKRKKKNIHLKVKDNGVGLTDKELSNPNSFGIIGLKERTFSLKGDIKFTSKPKKGTQVEIVFPSKQ